MVMRNGLRGAEMLKHAMEEFLSWCQDGINLSPPDTSLKTCFFYVSHRNLLLNYLTNIFYSDIVN